MNELEVDANEEEDLIAAWWWDSQAVTLLFGLLAGMVCHLLIRHFSTIDPMGNRAGKVVLDHFSTNNKMTLVVRTELGMGKGKVAAQCSHAAVACYKKALVKTPKLVKQWEMFGQAKVALKTESVDDLHLLKERAEELGLVACLVTDAGRTQVEAGAATVLGIGPGPAEVVDKVTGHLKLL